MPVLSNYIWEPDEQRYRDVRTGRFVSAQEVRAEVDRMIASQRALMPGLTERLFKGDVAIGEWQSEMEGIIKLLHVANAAAAKGGFANLTRGDLGRVSRIVRSEYTFLARFAQQLASGEQALNGRVLTRANSYMESARHTYEAVQRDSRQEVGFDIEWNEIQSGSHSCEDCIAETDKGQVPVGTLTLPGDRECGSGCNCSLMYGRSGDAADSGDGEGDQVE